MTDTVKHRRGKAEQTDNEGADNEVSSLDSINDQGWVSDADARLSVGATLLSQDDYIELFEKVLERHRKAAINACYRLVFSTELAARRSTQIAYHVKRRDEYRLDIELARAGNVVVILPAGRRLT